MLTALTAIASVALSSHCGGNGQPPCQPAIDLHINGTTPRAKVGEHVRVEFSVSSESNTGVVTPFWALQATILYDPAVLVPVSMTPCGSPICGSDIESSLRAPMEGLFLGCANQGELSGRGDDWPDQDGDMQVFYTIPLGQTIDLTHEPTLLWTMVFYVVGTGDASVRVTQPEDECCPEQWGACEFVDNVFHTRIFGSPDQHGGPEATGDLSSFASFDITHQADLDGDGVVGMNDLLMLLAYWQGLLDL